MPSFKIREMNIAYQILKTVLETPQQETFVGFVGREHLIGVTRHMSRFLNDGQAFMEYQRPPQVIEDPKVSDNTLTL